MTNSGESESPAGDGEESDRPSQANGSPPRADDPESPAAPIFDDVSPLVRRTPRQIGPGFWESIGWIMAFVLFEICGMFVGVFVWSMAASFVVGLTTGEIPAAPEMREIYNQQAAYVLGVIKFAEVFLFLAAIRWRFGREAFRLTGFRPPPAVHVSILALTILPAAVFSGQLYAVLMIAWQRLLEIAPYLSILEAPSSIEMVQRMAQTTPVMVLIFAVAVFPALNEEFLFRGLIGRGLVGRYGVLAGVTLTSLLFAAVHRSPVHVAALIPLAVVFHVAYLSSRSMWLAVLAHFLNNALSVLFMVAAVRTADDPANIPSGALDGNFSPAMLLASACCVISAVWLLWRLRVQWRLPSGEAWTAPEPGVAAPPADVEAHPVISHRATMPALALVLSMALFTTAFVVSLLI